MSGSDQSSVAVQEAKKQEGIEVRGKMKKPELLAPAGNLEKLQWAIRYGADAVYIGGEKYGLRAKAGNFTFAEMREGVKFAKQYGAKVYVAANIIAHNEDLEGFKEYCKELYDIGIAAVIIADPALIMACKEGAPDLEIHISTQSSITNWKTIQFWAEEGIPRVVLAREVSLEEIREMKKKIDIEIEAFIHGAMCIAYSGRCVLSNHMTARDANRGGCAQSCRWHYDLIEEDAEEELLQELAQDPSYTMSAKDLSMLEHIPELIEAGVDSFKIEGRMKSIHYIATVVGVYRKVIDAYFESPEGFQLEEVWREEIWKAAQRSLSTGFYFGEPKREDQLFGELEKIPKYDFAANVLEYDATTKIATVQQRNVFAIGDEVEFYGPNVTLFKQQVQEMWDEDMNPIERAPHAMMIVNLRVEQDVQPYYMMRKRK